jgi:hypothetical protein
VPNEIIQTLLYIPTRPRSTPDSSHIYQTKPLPYLIINARPIYIHPVPSISNLLPLPRNPMNAHNINNPTIATAPANHALAFTLAAPPCELGMLFVAAPPRYQLPISVNSPFCVNIATFGPTLLTLLLKLPKYEYLSMLSRRSKYCAEVLKKLWVSARGWLS